MSATELLEPILKGGLRSINFFNGRLLSAEDLSDEQNANRQARALVGQAVGEGVVYGLEVAKSSAGTNQSPVVTVSAGLAFNRRGQALRLPTTTDVALTRQTDGAAALPTSLVFKDCQQTKGGIDLPEDGLHLLTVAASEGREGRAPTSGLGNASAPCSARYTVEGVQFRLIELLKSNELGDLKSLRNRVAYQCFGIETLTQFESAPFSQPPRRYGLLDTLRPNTLTDGDVPLAAIYWTRNGGLEFIDLWSVRRRPIRPSISERWGALIDDRRFAEAEAMLLQFQEQIAAFQTAALQTPINLGNYKADERFAYLPPVGLLPIGAGAFNWRNFLGPHAPPEVTNIDEGLVRSIIARSVFIDPVKISPFADAEVSGQSPPIPLTVYRIGSNNDFVMFARSTGGRIRVFLGPAHTNVPGNQIFAESDHADTRHYAGPGNPAGIYQIVGLDAGDYRVTVTTSAFGATASTVVTEGRTTDVSFTSGAPGSINVTPKNKQTNQPISDLSKIQSVTATPSQGGSPIPGGSTSGEVWQINNLVAGTYRVTATVTGYLPHTPVPVVLAAGQVVNLDIRLDPVPSNNAAINLEVSDKATNRRIDAAVLSARATNLQPPNDVKLGEKTDNAWSIKQLPAGNYRVEVTATNYQPETVQNVALTTGQQKTLNVQMQAIPGTIALTVINKDNPQAPINDKVTNVTASNNGDDFTATLDTADGKWKIRNLPPGTYSLTVVATGFQTKTEQNIAVQANQTINRQIEMTPVQVAPGSLTFLIIDDRGHAIDDKVTSIKATLGSTTRPATQDTNTKRWSIIGLKPGAYSIEVAATNYRGKTVPDMEVVSGILRTIEISLEPLPGSIIVSASHSHTPINDKVTKVTASSSRGNFDGAPEGSQWKVSNLKPDTYSVTVEARDYQPKTEPNVMLTPGQARTLNVAMEPQPGSIKLTINDSRGAPIDNKVTHVTATGVHGSFNGSQGDDGKWKISNLRPGTYSVAASALNYTGTPSNVEVTSNAQTTATLRLEPNKGTLTLKLDVFAAPEGDEFVAVHLASTPLSLPPGVELTAVITPGNLSTTFADDAIERQISNVPVGELLTVTINTHPLTTFRLELPPGGQASRTVPVAPTSFGFRAGHPDHQHTIYSYLIDPEEIRTPLNKTPQTLDATERPWLTLWRDWLILTRPELGLDPTREPVIVVNITRSGPEVRNSGHAVFFRADNTKIGLTYVNTVTTVRPGTG